MNRKTRLLASGLLGALAGAVLSALAFLTGAIADGAGLAEAFGYGFIVAIIGGFLGGIIGLAVGLGNLGFFGGALAGLLVAMAVVVLYMMGFARAGEYSYFLSESRVLIAGLTGPLIMTGMVTAWLKNRYQDS